MSKQDPILQQIQANRQRYLTDEKLSKQKRLEEKQDSALTPQSVIDGTDPDYGAPEDFQDYTTFGKTREAREDSSKKIIQAEIKAIEEAKKQQLLEQQKALETWNDPNIQQMFKEANYYNAAMNQPGELIDPNSLKAKFPGMEKLIPPGANQYDVPEKNLETTGQITTKGQKEVSLDEKSKNKVTNFLIDAGLYGKPISENIRGMIDPLVSGSDKLVKGTEDVLDGDVLRGSAQLVSGTLQSAMNLIPGVVGLNATMPIMNEVGGSVAEGLGFTKEQGEQVTGRIAPFLFGRWIGAGSLASWGVDEGLTETGVLDGMTPEDQMIARELIGHLAFFGTMLGGKKISKAYLDPKLDKAFPYTRGMKADLSDPKVTRIMNDYVERFNEKKVEFEKKQQEAKTPEAQKKAADEFNKWAQDEIGKIIQNEKPAFFRNVKKDLENLKEARRYKKSESKEPLQTLNVDPNQVNPETGFTDFKFDEPQPNAPKTPGSDVKAPQTDLGSKLVAGQEKLSPQRSIEAPKGIKPIITPAPGEKPSGKPIITPEPKLKQLPAGENKILNRKVNTFTDGSEFAIKLNDGKILSHPKAASHLEVMELNKINADDVAEAGYINKDKNFSKDIGSDLQSNIDIKNELKDVDRSKIKIKIGDDKLLDLKTRIEKAGGKLVGIGGGEKPKYDLIYYDPVNIDHPNAKPTTFTIPMDYFRKDPGAVDREVKRLNKKYLDDLNAVPKEKPKEPAPKKEEVTPFDDSLAGSELIRKSLEKKTPIPVSMPKNKVKSDVPKKRKIVVKAGSKKQQVQDIKLSDIQKSEKDFQGRSESFSGESFKRIVTARLQSGLDEGTITDNKAEKIIKAANDYLQKNNPGTSELSVDDLTPENTFSWNDFGQVLLWKDPKGGLKLLSGHSRTAASEFLKDYFDEFESIPSLVEENLSFDEAQKKAHQSNIKGTAESLLSHVKKIQALRSKGKTEKEIKAVAKTFYGSDSNKIINLSMLNPDGYAIAALKLAEKDPDMNTIANWIGYLRSNMPELTNDHENEIYKWLADDNAYKTVVKNMTQLRDLIERRTNSTVFDPEKPLNLRNVKGKGGNLMQDYERDLADKKQEMNNAKSDLEKARAKWAAKGMEGKELEEKLTNENGYVNRMEAEYQKLLLKKNAVIDADMDQGALFNARDPEGYMTRNPEISDAIKNQGYDGIIQSEYGDEAVVFNANQIKSIDNKGSFSEIDKDIFLSAKSPDLSRDTSGMTKDQKELNRLRDYKRHLELALEQIAGKEGLMPVVRGVTGTDYAPSYFRKEMQLKEEIADVQKLISALDKRIPKTVRLDNQQDMFAEPIAAKEKKTNRGTFDPFNKDMVLSAADFRASKPMKRTTIVEDIIDEAKTDSVLLQDVKVKHNEDKFLALTANDWINLYNYDPIVNNFSKLKPGDEYYETGTEKYLAKIYGSTKPGEINFFGKPDMATLLEETIHIFQDKVGKQNPKLAEAIKLWESEVREFAAEYKIDIPLNAELFAKCFVHQAGYRVAEETLPIPRNIFDDVVKILDESKSGKKIFNELLKPQSTEGSAGTTRLPDTKGFQTSKEAQQELFNARAPSADDISRLDKYLKKVSADMPDKFDPVKEARLKELNAYKELSADEKLERTALRNEKAELLAADPFEKHRLSTMISMKIRNLRTGYKIGSEERQKQLTDLKKDIAAYARLILPRGDYRKSEITPLLTELAKAKDLDGAAKTFSRIRDLERKVKKRKLIGAINKMIRNADRTKGDPDFVIAIKNIRRMKAEDVETEIAKIYERAANRDLTDEEDQFLYLLQRFSDIKNRSVEELEDLYQELKEAIVDGRSRRKEWLQQEKARILEIKEKTLNVITGGKGVMSDDRARAEGLDKETISAGQRISDFDSMMHSWEWILDKISKHDKTSTPLHSYLNEYFADKIHVSRNLEDKGLRDNLKLFREKMMEIYGVKGHALTQMLSNNSERKETLAARVHVVERDEAGIPTQTENVRLVMSQNEAAYMLMVHEDPQLAKTFERMGYTEDTWNRLKEFVDPKVMAWARWQLDVFYPEYYKGVNEIYKQMRGVDLQFNKKYMPISRDVAQTVLDQEFLGDVNTEHVSIFNGHLQPRVSNTHAIRIQDIDRVLMEHVIEMEHFKAFAAVMKDLRGVFGSRDVSKAIKQYHSPAILKVINRFINDFARGGVDRRLTVGILDKIRSNFAKAVIGLNPVVFIKQLTSIPAYLMDMPVKDFTVGVGDFLLNPVGKTKFLFRNSEHLKTRYNKGWERDIILAMQRARKTTAKELSGGLTFTDVIMALPKFGDAGAIFVGGWAQYRYSYNKAKAAGKSHDEAVKIGIKEFEKTTKRAQQAGDVEDLGEIQRQGSWAKMWTLFKTSPKQYYSNMSGGLRNLVFKRGKANQNLKRMFVAHMLLPTIFQWVSNGFEWKAGSQIRAAMLGSLNGLLIAGDILETMLMAIAGDSYFSADETPITAITQDFVNALKKFNKWGTSFDMSAEEFLEAVEELASALSKPAGIPYDPVKRVGTGIKDFIENPDETSALRTVGFSEFITKQDKPEKSDTLKLIQEHQNKLNNMRKEARKTMDPDDIKKAKEYEQDLKKLKEKSTDWKKQQDEIKKKNADDPFKEPKKPKSELGKNLFKKFKGL